MEHAPLAARLLGEVRLAHEELIAHTNAGTSVRDGLQAVATAIAAALDGLSDERVLMAPVPDEWSMVEVVEHVHEHDRNYQEAAQHGVSHYVEHGLEHALQLWKLRRDLGLSAPPRE